MKLVIIRNVYVPFYNHNHNGFHNMCYVTIFFFIFLFFWKLQSLWFGEFSEVLTCLQCPVILPSKNTGMKKCSLTCGRFRDMQWPTKHGKSAIVLHATPCRSERHVTNHCMRLKTFPDTRT